jgi:predicted ribosome quality control (RQC) complex YloA/Tae2 family protein
MDSLILEGVIRSLARELSGSLLLRAERTGEWEYRLGFATASHPDLLVCLRPPHSWMHRAGPRARVPALPPDPFTVLLGQELEGAGLERMERPGLDRVVETVWSTRSGGARTLVAELIGKSANLLLLDERRRVLGFAREMNSAFRMPVEGEPYRPPLARKGLEGATLDPSRVPEYLDRFAVEGTLLAAGAAFLEMLSPSLGGDFPFREEAVADPSGALTAILSEARAGRFEPCLYTLRSPEEMLRDPSPADPMPVLSPFPLRRAPFPVETRYPSAEEASRMAAGLQERLRTHREARERISRALEREEQKLERLAGKLEEELRQSGRAEEFQRFGDLILAHPAARIAGNSITVTDLYDPAGRPVDIPADPSLSPRENAERHYGRARKLRRGAETIRGRLESVRSRLRRSAEWRSRLESARGDSQHRELEAALVEARILPQPKPAFSRPPRLATEGDAGVRKFRTADGFVILVGRTAADNDRLTFQMASPHDFWLHAAEQSGAHVVVRNPGKLSELPRPALLAAAQIAAHFSRARGKGKVEVHYTLRKYVRKGRGFAPGRVTLRNHRTLNVEPAIPGKEDG